MANKNNFTKLIILVVVISLLVGGGAGGLVTLSLSNNNGQNRLVSLVDNILHRSKTANTNSAISEQKVFQVEEESETTKAVEKVIPSVVSIIISKDLSKYYQSFSSNPWDEFFGWPFGSEQPSQEETQPNWQEVGGGTGFIVSSDGMILTNRHVISDTEAEYTVITSDDKRYEATVLATDSTNDLGILKIKTDEQLPVVELGDSDNLKIGQTVIAIGNTLSRYRNTVTKGVISGLSRSFTAGDSTGQTTYIEGAIQTDAAINPGNSGGPLINLEGQVIGMNTAIVNPTGAQTNIGIGFAIPINQAKEAIESVKANGRIIRPFLGIRYVLLNKDIAQANKLSVDYGALIIRGQDQTELAVVPSSPADKAGLVENDIILEYNGQKIDEDHSLAGEIAKSKVGDEIDLKIMHKGEEKVVKVKLEERAE